MSVHPRKCGECPHSSFRIPHSSFRWVHPRGRGEHMGRVGDVLTATGSSPRARGTRVSNPPPNAGGRFIPAGAGNTTGPEACPPSVPVHPRGRGEHRELAAQALLAAGSSPRARGTRLQALFERVGHRFIPAGAGNTGGRGIGARGRSVHPRGRGEHSGLRTVKRYPCGSSPRARGTPGVFGIELEADRFIPAGAGNT